jgi:hypothetical protein
VIPSQGHRVAQSLGDRMTARHRDYITVCLDHGVAERRRRPVIVSRRDLMMR